MNTASSQREATSTTTAPDPTGVQRLLLLARDIKLSHSIFALPFALLAAFLAEAYGNQLLSAGKLTLIVVCMVLARTVAMTMNRWADRNLDGDNPRTARRAIPSGQLSSRFVLQAALISSALFIAATGGFLAFYGNVWPLILSPLVLLWLVSYSFTKRFTWLCHLFLGSALGVSPLAAAIAVNPAYLQSPAPYLLAVMVMCWVAGFDVIYALQDVETDRETGIYSMPARLGVETALWISRAMHIAALAALIAFALQSPLLGIAFDIGVGVVAALLIVEHVIVWRSKINHINMVFFTLNGVISVVLGLLGVVEVVAHV